MTLSLQAVQEAAAMICWDDAREFFGEGGSSGLETLLNSIREFFGG